MATGDDKAYLFTWTQPMIALYGVFFLAYDVNDIPSGASGMPIAQTIHAVAAFLSDGFYPPQTAGRAVVTAVADESFRSCE